MTYNLIEHSTLQRSSIRRTFADLPTALEAIKAAPYNALFIEEDEDHPGHFDMITADGTIYALEPATA